MVAFSGENIDSEIRNFLLEVKGLGELWETLPEGKYDEEGSKRFANMFHTLASFSGEDSFISKGDSIDEDLYRFAMESFEAHCPSEVSIDGSGLNSIGGFAAGYGMSVMELVDSQCDLAAKHLSSVFEKHEKSRQKEIARAAYDNSLASDDDQGVHYVEESDPSKYKGVREDSFNHVGKELREPRKNLKIRSMYGYRSYAVSPFVTRFLVPASGIKSGPQSVYRCLLDGVNYYGVVGMSVPRIAERTNISERSISSHVEKLIDCGMLIKRRQGNGLSELSNEYRITLSCDQMKEDNRLLSMRWYALTGKPDFKERWDKYGNKGSEK